MTRRDRSLPEIFSLSFLDLIFCAMAGVLVLYAMADTGSPQAGADDVAVTFIEVQFKGNARTALISLVAINGDATFAATNQYGDSPEHSGASSWQFSGGGPNQPVIARLVINEKIDSEARLELRILDHEVGLTSQEYEFRKVRLGFGSRVPEVTEVLKASDNYVTELPL